VKDDVESLLELSKEVAIEAYNKLNSIVDEGVNTDYRFNSGLPREMKSEVDAILENLILKKLIPTQLPILSEERGELLGDEKVGLRFIVDPLDGTVNFIRGIGPSTISIALFHKDIPIFGVLVLFPSGDLIWGGKNFGSFINDKPIHVSNSTLFDESILCTGIPSRLDLTDQSKSSSLFKWFEAFGKVRMLGSASFSLIQVTKGSAEAYVEHEIMVWDVAAGLALIDGAGGQYQVSKGDFENSLNVVAFNGLLQFK